jgi:hypothetical protein
LANLEAERLDGEDLRTQGFFAQPGDAMQCSAWHCWPKGHMPL